MKKVLVSDYDKTFYLNDEDIEKNKLEINKFRNKGNIFIIATGRSYYDFKKKVNKYNIKYDYVILNHGATILDNNDTIISNIAMEDNIINDIKNSLHLNNSIESFCCSELESRLSFDSKSLTKINVKYNLKEQVLEVLKIIKPKYSNKVNIYHISEKAIEIVSNKVNKSKSIDLLLNKLKISKNNVYTIGDGYSDIEMIKNFNGYCMKDSIDELKKIAIKEFDSVHELIKDLQL